MKVFKLGNLFLASFALALVMLSGCSNSEESSSSDPAGESSSGDKDCSEFTSDFDVKECEVWNDMH